MSHKALPCLHRAGKIVMPVFHLWRSMLEHTRDQTDLLRKFHGQESRCRSTEIVKTHGLSKFGSDSCANNVIQAARNQGGPSIGDPEPVMLAATEQDRPYFLQIVHDVGHELLRYPVALGALSL